MKIILIAEDDQDTHDIFKRYLHRCGYQVISTFDGLEAFNILHQKKEDVHGMVCDINLPKLDGSQLIMDLQDTNSISANFPIIICTASLNAALLKVIPHLDKPNISIIEKPIRLQKFKMHLQKVVG